ncbi:RNA-binding protein 39-like [Hibiscus syriacus]|uniref:RNA-binding protein 39-like n=1 Tax=Hibiscus syriacus TaxID=106335 RepID=UPI001922FC37|nr:RNA-binding protein 39-like [Hibiscus syriacus]
MDFDEYEYLEKTVEEQEDPKKKKDGVSEDKSKRSYRKREGERREDDDEIKSSRKKSKGSRDEDDEERRDRDKERHRRSRDEDDEERRDRDKERHRKSRDEDDEERRDRDKERHRSSRDREREREREKDRDLESSREREREREEERERERRDRSSSRSRRHEKEEERRERSSSRSRRHESDRERDREREIDTRDSRRFKDKKEVVEPEADPERDQRTVFAYQMPLKATERDVYEFFSKAGKVRDVRLIMDRNSRRSKGVGYIEFYDVMSVPMAIALSGQLLLGQPVMVKPSEAEKNLVQSNTSGAGAGSVVGPYGAVDRKLYVGNLHFNMTEMQLRQIFEPFGPVELVQLPLDLETGQCKGFGFVQFAQLEHAKAAQGALNGKLEIAGRTIKVSSVTDHVGTQDPAAKSADFDDDEGGLALNAQSRALLMQKLDRSGIATSITSSLGVPLLNGSATIPQAVTLPVNGQVAYPAPVLPPIMCATPLDPIGQPSECLLLKNMFDPATETEPDFDMEIKEDVEEECSKYGRVKHIYVDKNSAGCVYLRFDSIGAAGKAQRAMHMRWFAGRSISALFMQPHEYESRFKG